jgi:putative spermidine/putrescine transport system substrate-binding protein
MPHRIHASRRLPAPVAVALLLSACAAPDPTATQAADRPWSQVLDDARGDTVRLWMYAGDLQGNAYVDEILAPAVQEELGVTLERVPVADTSDALARILSERQAGTEDGEVDLVWVNGRNFSTGRQAGAWLCGWADDLPNAQLTDPDDPLLRADFGTPVQGCEAPWHKAQFTLVYDSARVPDPPTTMSGVLQWAEQHPGRFTYPAPPDFTGSVFVREVLLSVAGGAGQVPLEFDERTYDRLTPPLWDRLRDVAPALWRDGQTYPRSTVELDRLFANGEIDMTMTYGPATLTKLVRQATYPPTTRVLILDDGTVGNASFLAIPASSGSPDAAMAVADLALSPEQQAAKADPDVWGQFTVLDRSRLPVADRAAFEALPESDVVPDFEVLSENAHGELAPDWVAALDEGWRRHVLGGAR